jgi:hypothetical protein
MEVADVSGDRRLALSNWHLAGEVRDDATKTSWAKMPSAGFLVEIRTAQVETAAWAAQLAAVLFQLRGAVGAEAGSCQSSRELQSFG